MKQLSIVAENANAALTKIYEQLGPDAVVVSVRKVPRVGIARLLQSRPQLEVTACVPQTSSPGKNEVPNRKADTGRWRSIVWLESNGLLPAFTSQLEEKVYLLHGEQPLPTVEEEWTAVTDLVICHWREARQSTSGTGRPHVFIGPAGSGKTTVICKWMTSAVLLNEQQVRVWRLDADTANASELLALHCELIGVPMARFWKEPTEPADLQFVDLPGIEIQNPYAIAALRDQISDLPQPHVHLVLNAAYETSILFEQFHAFESFAPEDIIFTHLDEEHQRVKLWNFVLGTNCPVSFLGAGQKIPGELRRAEPALLFPQKNRR